MAVRVARGRHQRGEPVGVDAGEHVTGRRGAHRVHRHLHVALGGVLDPHRHGQRAAQLAVHLARCRTGSDRPPRHGVGDVLRGDRVEELAPDGEPELGDVQQQLPGQPQPLVDGVRAVEIRVVDEALPAQRGARFLEVHAHDDAHLVANPLGVFGQQARVVQGRVGVVHGARTHHHEQAVVAPVEDLDGVAPADRDGLGDGGSDGMLRP